ncbi:hypothetical protein F2Q69_00006799 [Brassica cretica]|uniref:Uncharacterized protein n=1 Tax=Brassica cretica TaxID=69181 RepID=A0A8S9P456_BRACR|nr:hypothetical protein F2Q69_00006799 [Brassica cretica]
MFFRETREKEEDIKRMFCKAREKMRMRITLKMKSDPGQFAIPCTVKGGAFAQIVHFCGFFPEELRMNFSIDAEYSVSYSAPQGQVAMISGSLILLKDICGFLTGIRRLSQVVEKSSSLAWCPGHGNQLELGHYRSVPLEKTDRDCVIRYVRAAWGVDDMFVVVVVMVWLDVVIGLHYCGIHQTTHAYRRAFDLFGARKSYWEDKDEYGIYRDDQGCTIDMDGHIINVSKEDIRKVLERASRDEPSFICLPEHATFFTQTKLVLEIYTKDEINEMFYGVCVEQEKNKEAFQMKLDCVYYPLNDSISWLTTFMKEMKQDIARIQHATDIARSTEINIHRSTLKLYKGNWWRFRDTLPVRPEALSSIDRHNNKSTDIHHRTSVDDATDRGRLVPTMTSDMSDTHYHGEEISADTYATLRIYQFNLESLEERLQRMENTTATMKEKWRRGDEAMRDFSGTWFNKRRDEMDICFPTSSNFQH